MTMPSGYGYSRVLMIAQRLLYRRSTAAPLPNIQTGQAFWADATDHASLLAAGDAIDAPANYSPVPPMEPPYTVNGVPGLGVGAANSSH
jgi:hypothetical protein